MVVFKLQTRLRSHKAKIAVWGTGCIGLSTLAYYASRGIKCVGYDISKPTIENVKAGKISTIGLEHWLGFSIEPLVKNGLISATNNVREVLDDKEVKVHFVSIPTERNGRPWDGALLDVAKKLSAKTIEKGPDLVIVESTLAPGQCDRLLVETIRKAGRNIPRDFWVAVAPRRDWFDNPGLNVHTIPRVVGGYDEESMDEAIGVLSIICSKLIPVSSHRVAELVKSTENSFRALNIAFANALSRAYPDVDVNELIAAAATKWNYLAHYPGIGTGGYCIPLAPEYLIEGATTKGPHLDLLTMINTVNTSQTHFVGDLVARTLKGSSVGILGLSYKRNLKVHVLSPSLGIVERLKKAGKEVYVQDPFYSANEIRALAHVETFAYPDDLAKFEAIIVTVPHSQYTETPVPDLLENLRRGTLIIDAEGAWESYRAFFPKKAVDYRRIGDAGWAHPRN